MMGRSKKSLAIAAARYYETGKIIQGIEKKQVKSVLSRIMPLFKHRNEVSTGQYEVEEKK